jgi:methyl-accepting chemotaxis protein
MLFDKGQGYVLAYRADSTVMVHGTLPKLEGTITNGKDSNGVLIASAVIAAANSKPEGATATYLYPRPGQDEPDRKSCSPVNSRRGTSSLALASMWTTSMPT